MPDPVKREYRSDLRSAQARQTRDRIVAAAADLFVADGYAGTTVDAVATAAGVSRKTVFAAVGGKAELLSVAIDSAIAGDGLRLPLAERPEVLEMLALDDAGRVVDAWAALVAGIDARVGGLFAALEIASAEDATALAVFDTLQSRRRQGAASVVDAIIALDAVKAGLSRADAVDLAWLFSEPLLHVRLVGRRRWSARRFERWLAATLRQQLLGLR